MSDMPTIQTTQFAVVDVETTGLFPGAYDRIVEIAVVRVEPDGAILDEYATLVNPDRDVGPTDIHGISASDVKNAPRFREIVGDVIARMAGAVFVAHNVHFDMRFLRAEMARLGHELPTFPFLCTMQLARRADPGIPSRRLDELCRHFGIRLEGAHCAYMDARAEAALLARCLACVAKEGVQCLADVGVQGSVVGVKRWPSFPVSGTSYRRAAAARDRLRQRSYIAGLVARLPATGDASTEMDSYLSLLDGILEDRKVTQDEAAALFALAGELGVSRNQALAAHQAYMQDLIRVALSDGVITEAEQTDLAQVRLLLNISETDYARLCRDVRTESGSRSPTTFGADKAHEIIEGKSICFTGALVCRVRGERATRELAERIAAEHGMIVKNSVTKNLDLLVVADPDTMSGKAKKARQYGIRMIAEAVFWRMMGLDVE
jgi:DNA polymerase-3 subunit epsilon